MSNQFIKIFGPNSTQRLVMSDYIMFNKSCELTLELVDRFLPYCKFKFNSHENYQIDGWSYSCPGFYIVESRKPHYSIKFSMDNYDQLKLLTSEEEKRLAVRAMIQIMNECDVEQINLENYYVISEWYYLNDHLINSYESNISHINSNPMASITTESNSMIVLINGLATKEEIVKILYSNAVNGSRDCNIIFGMDVPYFSGLKSSTIEKNLSQIDLSSKVENIGLAKINTHINSQQIDLHEYCEINGLVRTGQVIEQIKHLTKHRITMDDWVEIDSSQPINKYKLISELHNKLKPYGMGMFAHATTIISELKVQKMYEDKNYVDYLNGIAIKLDLSIYPILDIKKFEDRNGSFVKYLTMFAKSK